MHVTVLAHTALTITRSVLREDGAAWDFCSNKLHDLWYSMSEEGRDRARHHGKQINKIGDAIRGSRC